MVATEKRKYSPAEYQMVEGGDDGVVKLISLCLGSSFFNSANEVFNELSLSVGKTGTNSPEELSTRMIERRERGNQHIVSMLSNLNRL